MMVRKVMIVGFAVFAFAVQALGADLPAEDDAVRGGTTLALPQANPSATRRW